MAIITELGGREIMSVHLDVMNKLPVELSIGFWFMGLLNIEVIVIGCMRVRWHSI